MFLILLAVAVVFLPACGSKNNVKSEKAPETVLNPEETPVATVSAENPASSPATSHTHHAKAAQSITNATAPVSVTTPSSTPVVAQTTPPVVVDTTTPVQKTGSVHWFLWLLVLLVLGGIGWYFWSKSQEEHQNPTQPMPPTGGLSPVSGFTAVKDRIEDEAEAKPSFWSKKIF
jgi:cobalamin biosynthesis Mg chelatase CobN